MESLIMYTSPTKSSFSKNNHGVEFKSSESDSLYFYSYTPTIPAKLAASTAQSSTKTYMAGHLDGEN